MIKRRLDRLRTSLRERPQFIRFIAQIDSLDKMNDSVGNWMLGVTEKRGTSFKDVLDLFRNVLMLGGSFAMFGQYARHQVKRAVVMDATEYVCGWALLIAMGLLCCGLLYQGFIVMLRLPFSGRWPIKMVLGLIWMLLAVGFFFLMVLAITQITDGI